MEFVSSQNSLKSAVEPSFEGFVILRITNNPVKEGWVKNPEYWCY
jgi:hypothetical protein